MSTDVIRTLHARMIRGTTKVLDRYYRDEHGRTVDLTNAKIWYSMSADAKVAPSVLIASMAPAVLTLGTLGTIVQALQGGNDVQIQLVADGGGSIVVEESLVTAGLAQVNRLVKAHYQATVHTTAQLEAALAASTLLKVKTASLTPTYVLQNSDAMGPSSLVGGPPNSWRTGIVIDPDQNSFQGHYTITVIPDDTGHLIAMGDDDPWLHECDVQLADGSVNPDFSGKMAIWPETTDVPS